MVRLVHLSEGEFSIDQPIQPKVEKSKLQNIHKRILAEREDELCKLLEKKNKTIECLTKALEDVESDVDRANTLNTTLIELEPKTPNVRESEEKVVDNDTQAATMPKTKLKEIHQEITELKNALNELKKQNQLLQKVRKKRGNQLGEDGENINSENKCDEESGRDVLQRIAFLKNNLMCDDLDEERRELLERKLQLTEEYEQIREKVEDAINFMKNYDLDSTLEADRDRIKLIKSSLINKETELDVFKDVVHDAVQKVNDKKQCLEDRQGILNNYKLKCDQVKDLIEQQEKSVAHMNTLYESTMNDIFNEFAAIKSSLSQELQQLLPIIGKLKDAQTQLQNSETLLTISNQKRDSMHQELNYLKSQVENIHEDIHWAKKNEPSDDQNEKLNKQLAQWENDIQVQFNERVALKEKMAELRTNIRKAATKAQEKQKELCQLRLVEVDLRDLLVQQYQHRERALQGCRELGIVDAEYLQAQREQLDGSSRLTLVKPLAESDGC